MAVLITELSDFYWSTIYSTTHQITILLQGESFAASVARFLVGRSGTLRMKGLEELFGGAMVNVLRWVKLANFTSIYTLL